MMNTNIVATDIYVISAICFDYNDEYYIPSDDCGGSAGTPLGYCLDFESAKERLKHYQLESINSVENMNADFWDNNYNTRWEWYFKHYLEDESGPAFYEPYSIDCYDFPIDALKVWCNYDEDLLVTYAPKAHCITKVPLFQ